MSGDQLEVGSNPTASIRLLIGCIDIGMLKNKKVLMGIVVFKPPDANLRVLKEYSDRPSVFLSGSIEQGKAENWQSKLIKELSSKGVSAVIFNPRRDDWDASWEQDINFFKFREQVEWELTFIERADIVCVYFAPDTKSPITLLELGLLSQLKPRQTIVYCPKGYWRKGNVDIVCRRYSITQVNDWAALLNELIIRLLRLKWTDFNKWR